MFDIGYRQGLLKDSDLVTMLIKVPENRKANSGFGNSGNYVITIMVRSPFDLIPSLL